LKKSPEWKFVGGYFFGILEGTLTGEGWRSIHTPAAKKKPPQAVPASVCVWCQEFRGSASVEPELPCRPPGLGKVDAMHAHLSAKLQLVFAAYPVQAAKGGVGFLSFLDDAEGLGTDIRVAAGGGLVAA